MENVDNKGNWDRYWIKRHGDDIKLILKRISDRETRNREDAEVIDELQARISIMRKAGEKCDMRIKEVDNKIFIEKIGSPREEWLGPFTIEELHELTQHIESYFKMGPNYDINEL
jgi:hypothetical protein